MPEYRLPYGKTHRTLRLPESYHVERIAPHDAAPLPDPAAAVARALDQPVGGVRLSDFSGAQSAAVVISDKTRPIPHAALYPLLERLEALGLPPPAITLLIATGAHPPMTPDEFPKVLPADLLARYPVISHDGDDPAMLEPLGQTRRGTPVWCNRHLRVAELRVVIGNIEPHQFVGFSGGVKSAAIGLAGRATINHNHAMMSQPGALLGHYEDNPARQDVEEIGQMMGIHLALNTILTPDKQIAAVLVGEPMAVMRAGIPEVRDRYAVRLDAPCDLIFTSPGGHPKDINLYQAQKALAHAALVTKDGGAVVLVAACSEGVGSAKYAAWMVGMTSYQAVLDRFAAEGFELGPHKAFLFARDMARVQTWLHSEMPPAQVERLLLTPLPTLDDLPHTVLRDLPPDARIGVMPVANATLPVLA
jgi:lactate racemase